MVKQVKENRPTLTEEQRRVRGLFDCDLGRSVLEEWKKITARPLRQTNEATYAALGQQAFVQDIEDLLNYKEPR